MENNKAGMASKDMGRVDMGNKVSVIKADMAIKVMAIREAMGNKADTVIRVGTEIRADMASRVTEIKEVGVNNRVMVNKVVTVNKDIINHQIKATDKVVIIIKEVTATDDSDQYLL